MAIFPHQKVLPDFSRMAGYAMPYPLVFIPQWLCCQMGNIHRK